MNAPESTRLRTPGILYDARKSPVVIRACHDEQACILDYPPVSPQELAVAKQLIEAAAARHLIVTYEEFGIPTDASY